MNPKAREFENDTYLQEELRRLISVWKIKTVVETGTEYGGSANAFSKMPPVTKVITIDITRKFDKSDLLPGVEFILGDSRAILRALKGRLPAGRILFFLDAHSSIETDECPLRGELTAIMDMRLLATPPILVIHDCVVPGKDFGFDSYRDGPICWEWVSDLVAKVYPDGYVKAYNDKAAGSKRGCLFVEPFAESTGFVPTPEETQRMSE